MQTDSKKSLEAAYVAAGGQIKQNEDHPVSNGKKTPVSKAVKDYLADCNDRQGKTGYGLATRTPETYEYRLGFLTEFKPEASMDDLNEEFIKGFRRFLHDHGKDLSDRTSYIILQAVSTFLIKNGSRVAKPILKEIVPTEVIPYSNDEMQKFFAACDEEDELLFKFFLHSMSRDTEVANCEVRDLKFDKNILHIAPSRIKSFV